ncbi:hypothetical protein AB1Y20_020283 [Prymnesium parvum]|uniref:Katanin p80 subunit C-terminal domain-containing protein n=1 Tax=Prymnesium parvum TaxID=97485 RepID=A0AB34JUN6_PRYPA
MKAGVRPAGRTSREYSTPPRGRRTDPRPSSEAKELIYNHELSQQRRRKAEPRDRPATPPCAAPPAHPAAPPCVSTPWRGAAASPPGAPTRTPPPAADPSWGGGERRHAADSIVVPTARRAMGRARGAGGLVPVGRDLPIGLDITSFLGPANPFGQQPVVTTRPPPDEELMRSLTEPCAAMSRVLSARLAHLRVISALWASSPRRALLHALDMDDQAVLVDVLNAAQPRLAVEMGLELAQDLMPALARLVDSEYEDYLICGLTALGTVLKVVGPQLRDASDAVARGLPYMGVDLQMEERLERCAALREGLQGMYPRLSDLSLGKGRSAQLAARVCRSMERSMPDTD